MKTSTSLVVALLIIISSGYFVIENNNDVNTLADTPDTQIKSGAVQDGKNTVVKDGIQYVTIVARGGYSPRKSFGVADVPTKFIIKTSGTYDCSASLAIHSLNFRKILPNTGETIIDAGTPKVGDTIQGVCAMGMYSFAVEFK